MTSRKLVLGLLSATVALLVVGCEPVSVAPWPYTTATADAGAVDGGSSNDAASHDAGGLGMSGAGGIAANYAPSPLRCDGGLCDTDNYSLCSVANGSGRHNAGTAIPVLFAVASIGIERRRRRRNVRRSS
jgi:hypothetical protein